MASVLPVDGITDQDPHSTLPSVRARCALLVLPLLRLVAGVFHRLSRDTTAAQKVGEFVAAHSKVLKHALRRPYNHHNRRSLDGIDTPALQEIAAATTLLNLLASHPVVLALHVSGTLRTKAAGPLTNGRHRAGREGWFPENGRMKASAFVCKVLPGECENGAGERGVGKEGSKIRAKQAVCRPMLHCKSGDPCGSLRRRANTQ